MCSVYKSFLLLSKGRQVQERIRAIESKYKDAADWLNNTGSGVTDENNLREALVKRCQYYYELQPIMEERPNVRPLYTNQMDVEEDDGDSIDSLLQRHEIGNRNKNCSDSSCSDDTEQGPRTGQNASSNGSVQVRTRSVTPTFHQSSQASVQSKAAGRKSGTISSVTSLVKNHRRTVASKSALSSLTDGINEYYNRKASRETLEQSKLRFAEIEKLHEQNEIDEIELIKMSDQFEYEEEIDEEIKRVKFRHLQERKRRRLEHMRYLMSDL